MGYNRAAVSMERSKTRKRAIAVVVVAVLLVCIPLGITSYQVATSRILVQRTQAAALRWLAGSKYVVYSIEADGGTAHVTIAGDGPLPEFKKLLTDLGKTAGKVKVDLKVVPERTFSGTTKP